jgi:hypothetical protein
MASNNSYYRVCPRTIYSLQVSLKLVELTIVQTYPLLPDRRHRSLDRNATSAQRRAAASHHSIFLPQIRDAHRLFPAR